jgi:hypothetical protein
MAQALTSPASSQNELYVFGQIPLTPSVLSVAQENFTASRPPIRSLNVTEEILGLLRSYSLKQSISKIFEETPPVPQNTLRFTRRLTTR